MASPQHSVHNHKNKEGNRGTHYAVTKYSDHLWSNHRLPYSLPRIITEEAKDVLDVDQKGYVWAFIFQAPAHQHYDKPEGYDRPSPEGALAPRLQNLGTYAFKVTTKSERAQLFINQGVNLAYGFNHAEAARAFAEAARR